jgi:3'-phosphoadenosine 5'-phosphosulfate (PAPS) 3'-phosphatase
MIDTRAEKRLVELLPRIVDLAKEAGQAILNVYAQAHLAVKFKQDNSPLTQADPKSHRVIVDGLSSLSPDWPISQRNPKRYRSTRELRGIVSGLSILWTARRSFCAARANLR